MLELTCQGLEDIVYFLLDSTLRSEGVKDKDSLRKLSPLIPLWTF